MADFVTQDRRQRLFGNDLQVVERMAGLDLRPDDLGDLAVAQGNDNIIQALILRLSTRRGELAPLGWPDYGSRIHELLGEPNHARTHQKLLAYTRAAVEQDPRVKEVTNAQAVAVERGVARVTLDITLIDTPEPLNLVFAVNLETTF